MLAKKTFKNQITLPKEVLKSFPETEYFDVVPDEDGILLRPVQIVTRSPALPRLRQKMQRLGITLNDIQEAIHWARRPG